MSRVIFRPTASEDNSAVLALHNQVFSEMPPVGLEDYLRWMTSPPGARIERYVVEVDGEVVGGTDFREEIELSRPNTYFAYLQVEESQRGRGYGSMLFDSLTQRLRANGAERVYAEVSQRDERSQQFAEKRGFVPTGKVDRQSRLDLRRAKLDGMEEGERRLVAEGIRIMSLEEIGLDDPTFIRSLFDLEVRTARDIPTSEDIGEVDFEGWLRDQTSGPGRSPTWYWVAMDGDRPVGLARLRMRGERAAGNSYTGVEADYRGRGIAIALKFRAIRWARGNGIDWFYTGNEASNRPILAINRSLGYEPVSYQIEMVKEFGL
jgi:GNAT superfamily N-acetyltransferase